MGDAETLLRRINHRNLTRQMNLPAPQQETFLPRQASIPPKVGGQCHGEGCSKDPNMACPFSLCKACCDGRPSGTKTCLTHRLGAKGSRAHPPLITVPRPPNTGAPPPLTKPCYVAPRPQPHPADQPVGQPSPSPSPSHHPDQPGDLPALPECSDNARPGLLPRSDPALSGPEASRRRSELSQASRNSRNIYIWFSVCLCY